MSTRTQALFIGFLFIQKRLVAGLAAGAVK